MTPFRLGPIPSTVARKGALAAGVLAALAAAFILVGIILPGTFEVTRSVEIAAPPETVFPFLNSLDSWTEWTPWGAVESRLEGPPAGRGARRVWDDPDLGSGSLSIAHSRPPRSVDYVVEVDGGKLRFEGTITVEPRGGGSLVTWTERADLGWNPLLGWTALNMEDSQGRQLRESLERLRERVEAAPRDAYPPSPTASPAPA